jgi:predicted thioesterase
MKEADEEGIGSGIELKHHSPALIGQEVIFEAILIEVNHNEVVTEFVAKVNERLIASGKQWQKILKKEKLKRIFEAL